MNEQSLKDLSLKLEGELLWDRISKTIFSTDASVYREVPLAVFFPKDTSDLKKIIGFAAKNKVPLIPRSGGTSLAGQAIGKGIVVDVSKYMTRIEEVNVEQQWVRVQPGIIRDVLNFHLKPHDLYFAPETSTANRATIGGMVANNSCGSNSIRYGATVDHILELECILSDGSVTHFKKLTYKEWQQKRQVDEIGLEGEIYQSIYEMISDPSTQKEIQKGYPKKSIPRRNTGYAIDRVLESFLKNQTIDLCKLIAGSEGTLAFITAIKLNCVPLPPKNKSLICVHFTSVYEALLANKIAVTYKPSASELIDDHILKCTEKNITQRKNRFFIQGSPQAILVIEIAESDKADMDKKSQELISSLQSAGLGYAFPILAGEDIAKVWSLRKAGLGLLANMPGGAKPVTVIEDTAVDVENLPEYIAEIDRLAASMNLTCIHYAHAGSGEIHSRPVIDIKTEKGKQQFRKIAVETAKIVKKYHGSLSGEHGDGRLRGEFIPFMIGDKNYQTLLKIKNVWDRFNIFNPNKITQALKMDESFRSSIKTLDTSVSSILDFSSVGGMVQMSEQCNGAGDCRKTNISGGVMCPSYMATRNEKETTRARANLLREVFYREKKPFENKDIKEILELCLSCKGCKSECNANVDMAKLKMEFLYHYHKTNRRSFSEILMANFVLQMKISQNFWRFYNFMVNQKQISYGLKKILRINPKRSLPNLHKTTAYQWYKKSYQFDKKRYIKTVFFFFDEFTNYNEPQISIRTIDLLTHLGYKVISEKTEQSGRAFLSKGFLEKSKKISNNNIKILYKYAEKNIPILGVEPSAVMSFRDEYIDLSEDKEKARKIAQNTFTLEEFFSFERDQGNINQERFTSEDKTVWVHAHCYQKVLSSQMHHKKMLTIPKNYRANLIPSGCCGMAGSFGYEKQKYDISMKIANISLIPAIKNIPKNDLIASSGTSCRHQIYDCLGLKTLHPVEILWQALIE